MSNGNVTAPTQFVQTQKEKYAYRRFGKKSKYPLLCLQHFTGTLDNWDPAVTDPLSADHDVILFDNAGVGASTGKTPSTVREMADGAYAFCRTLGLTTIHVMGFSLGGMIAQQLALDHPDLVDHLLLLGTGPRGGEGMTFTDLSIDELGDPAALLMKSFFTPSEPSQDAAHAYIERLTRRTADRDTSVSARAAVAELAAIREWGVIPQRDRFAMLGQIRHPTLVVHGNKDVVVAPINAFLLAEHIPNAQLIMYPDASHGAASQYKDVFLQHARIFLE